MPKRILVTLIILAVVAVVSWREGPGLWERLIRWDDCSGKNFLLVTLDTTRADYVTRLSTSDGLPGYDRLTEEGVTFRAAVAPSTITVPSHASILTGLYPKSHGVQSNAQSLDKRLVSMADAFKGAGYSTAAFVSCRGILSKNLTKGFDIVDDEVPEGSDLVWQRSAEVTNEKVFRWLGETRSDPFFLWVHYYDPHSPTAITDAAMRRMPGYDGFYKGGFEVGHSSGSQDMDQLGERDLEFLAILYEEEIRAVDKAVDRLWTQLDSLDLWDDTVIILTADHGQSLGEENYIGHGGDPLHEPVIHVPLVMRASGAPMLARRSVRRVVGLCDLFPAVLELFPSLEKPYYPLEGRSWLRDCSIVPRGGPAMPAFVEAPGDFDGEKLAPREVYVACLDDWKLTANRGRQIVTPFETTPSTHDEAPPTKIETKLATLLDTWIDLPSPLDTTAAPAMDEESRKALQALGYLQ